MGAFAPRFDEDNEELFESQLEQLTKVAHWHDNKPFLDTLSAEYIKTLVNTEKYYKHIFYAEDWQAITRTSKYRLDITAEQHGMTTPYVSAFYIEVDGVLKEALPEVAKLYPNTVRVKTYYPQNGFLIIKDKEN